MWSTQSASAPSSPWQRNGSAQTECRRRYPAAYRDHRESYPLACLEPRRTSHSRCSSAWWTTHLPRRTSSGQPGTGQARSSVGMCSKQKRHRDGWRYGGLLTPRPHDHTVGPASPIVKSSSFPLRGNWAEGGTRVRNPDIMRRWNATSSTRRPLYPTQRTGTNATPASTTKTTIIPLDILTSSPFTSPVRWRLPRGRTRATHRRRRPVRSRGTASPCRTAASPGGYGGGSAARSGARSCRRRRRL